MTYDFAFVLDADPHDETVEDRFLSDTFSDATLILQNGALALSFDRDGASYHDAVISAYRDIMETGVDVLSFDPDYLVTSAEIARRVGLTRAAISKYEHSSTDNGFPAPFRLVLSKRPYYDWVAVSKWFVERNQLDVMEYRHALVSRVVNVGAQTRKLANVPLDVPDLVHRALEAA